MDITNHWITDDHRVEVRSDRHGWVINSPGIVPIDKKIFDGRSFKVENLNEVRALIASLYKDQEDPPTLRLRMNKIVVAAGDFTIKSTSGKWKVTPQMTSGLLYRESNLEREVVLSAKSELSNMSFTSRAAALIAIKKWIIKYQYTPLVKDVLDENNKAETASIDLPYAPLKKIDTDPLMKKVFP